MKIESKPARIKVCHIITKLELGGAQQNTLYTVDHLNKERFEAMLISGTGGMLDADASALKGVKTVFTGKLVRRICPANDAMSLLKLYFTLRKERPQVVHTHSSKAGILGRIAAWLARVPVVVHTFHGFGFHALQSWPVRTFYVTLEKACAKFSDKLIVVSKENTIKALDNGIGKESQYMVIRSGIETNKFKNLKIDKDQQRKKLGIEPGETVVTTIGPFKPQKNLEDFIKVAAKVLTRNKNYKFLIIGDGELRPQLTLQIQSLGLTDKILLLGWRRDIAEILAVSEIFAMTSLWEGLPRSILEAMCSSLPVIANSVDGVKEIVKDGQNGYLVGVHDLDTMANYIIRLASSDNLRRELGSRGLSFISKDYDIDQMVSQQEELYMELLRSKGLVS